MATKRAMYNLIYRLRKANLGRIETRSRLIYYHYEATLTHAHKRLVNEIGFLIQLTWA